MFVVLEHTTETGVHWDLMLELPAKEGLATWRLLSDPLEAPGRPVAAERIGDHRRSYLTYEGPISGGRGQVRRVDAGEAIVIRADPARTQVHLTGARLRGRFEIVAAHAGGLLFRRCDDAAAAPGEA